MALGHASQGVHLPEASYMGLDLLVFQLRSVWLEIEPWIDGLQEGFVMESLQLAKCGHMGILVALEEDRHNEQMEAEITAERGGRGS